LKRRHFNFIIIVIIMSDAVSSLLPPLSNPDNTRLVTVVAHVDHGKTTLCDYLISSATYQRSTRLISDRLAGTVRYLDFDPEEQRRGITMRASGIVLTHKVPEPKRKQQQTVATKTQQQLQNVPNPILPSSSPSDSTYTIHLHDSPGHSDFGLEVSTSLLVTDIALLLVDCVEGMGARTHQVLREAFGSSLIPILVLNKIDRLCTDLHLDPVEAYVRLRELLETVNASAAAMLASARADQGSGELSEPSNAGDNAGDSGNTNKHAGTGTSNKDVEDMDRQQLDDVWTFNPGRGNVIFASALYGMGFTSLGVCKSLYQSGRVQIKPGQLAPYLFGDYKTNAEATKVFKWKPYHQQEEEDEEAGPLFARFALEPLWSIWNAVSARYDNMNASLLTTTANSEAGDNKSIEWLGPIVDAMQIGSTASPGVGRNQKPMPSSCRSGVSSVGSSGLPATAGELAAALNQHGARSGDVVTRWVLQRYRPVARAVLDAVCAYGPSPRTAASSKGLRKHLFQILSSSATSSTTATPETASALTLESAQKAVYDCDPASPDMVAFVCKFLATNATHLQDRDLTSSDSLSATKPDSPILLGLTRVLSGTLETAGRYCAASYDGIIINASPNEHNSGGNIQQRTTIARRTTDPIRLYLLLGSSFVQVDRVPAGHVCAVLGLESAVGSTPATLYSSSSASSDSDGRTLWMPSMQSSFQQPLVKVHVEPVRAGDLSALERGLRMLQLSDAGVQVTDDAVRGELLLACRGELHLEQSLVDLQTKLLAEPIELRVSDPIVDFGEATDWMDQETEQYGTFLDAAYPHSSTRRAGPSTGRSRPGATTAPMTKRLPAPARQASLPPYNEEEGLGSAAYGRARSFLTGRGAAIRLRVVPLVPSAYSALSKRTIGDVGCEPELMDLGRALGMAKGATPQEILDALCTQCLFCSEDNEAAMVETPALFSGWCVKGVIVDDPAPKDSPPSLSSSSSYRGGGRGSGEVYVPPLSVHAEESSNEPAPNERDDALVVRRKQQAYDNLTDRIHECGFWRARVDGGAAATSNGEPMDTEADDPASGVDAAAFDVWKTDMRGSAVAGFQMALRSGPLCEEPIRNVLIVLEGVEVAMVPAMAAAATTTTIAPGSEAMVADAMDAAQRHYQPSKPLQGGMVVSTMRSGIRSAMLTRPARLVEGVLRLTLHSSLSGLGSLYGVLSKRRGRVVHDSTVDGTDLLLIEALIPAAEAFGLAPELFGKTSGEVTAPEMVFSHWERLDVDPFWIPTSLEEREDYGELQTAGDSSTGLDNSAIKYIRQVRRRKGLSVDSSRTVVSAEKQRTLKR
jgi:ribosome assembly protein 1